MLPLMKQVKLSQESKLPVRYESKLLLTSCHVHFFCKIVVASGFKEFVKV